MMSRRFLTSSRRTPAYLPCERSWRIVVELFRRKNSDCWQYDFMVRGKRFRGSTKETTKTRAAAMAALMIMSQAIEGNDPLPRKAPLLQNFATRFLEWAETTNLEQKTKTYY